MNIQIKESKEHRIHRQRMARITAERRRILALEPEKAVDAILNHPQSTALVHSMAEEDFFFLVHDIGARDALELLSLASNRQWEYILDLEVWNRDRINVDAVTYWLNLLHQADPPRFIEWTTKEKYDLLEYYLHRTMELRVREEDEDPSDFGDGFFTYDSTFYLRFREDAFNGFTDEESREELENFVFTMLERLADEDHVAYQLMLLRTANVMPGESEEEALHFRNIRLAEKGFLPFEEAVGVYAPIRPETVKKHPRKVLLSSMDENFNLPVPVNHSFLLSADTLFGKALQSIDVEEILNDIQVEFAALCNQIIAADQDPVREREALRTVVNKSCGYLGIGLHRLAGTEEPPGPVESGALLRDYPLADIFRTGYGLVAELRNRAVRWHRKSWFHKNLLALSFWGERLVGHIGGLLLKRPKFFCNYASGELYREFSSMQDIRAAESALNEAITFDGILSRMEINIADFPNDYFITHENLLLTLWARKRIGVKKAPKPIAIEKFRPFYRSLWSSAEAPPRITDSTRSDFLNWMAEETEEPVFELSIKAGEALERLFRKVEDEFTSLSAEALDHRFVQLFMLKKN